MHTAIPSRSDRSSRTGVREKPLRSAARRLCKMNAWNVGDREHCRAEAGFTHAEARYSGLAGSRALAAAVITFT